MIQESRKKTKKIHIFLKNELGPTFIEVKNKAVSPPYFATRGKIGLSTLAVVLFAWLRESRGEHDFGAVCLCDARGAVCLCDARGAVCLQDASNCIAYRPGPFSYVHFGDSTPNLTNPAPILSKFLILIQRRLDLDILMAVPDFNIRQIVHSL